MRRLAFWHVLLLSFVATGLLASGCGGSGGGSVEGGTPSVPPANVPPAGPVTILTWEPPAKFADNTPIDPYRDIDHYEVYAREDTNFTNTDLPVMVIPALTSIDSTHAQSTGDIKNGRKPLSEFTLEYLNPHVSKATPQYVSLKVVGVDGQKSAFTPPIAWDRM